MLAKIRIQEIPFEEILRSSYETLSIECIGTLFGEDIETRRRLLWVVEAAHPIQLAKRFSASTYPEDGSIRADWSLLYDVLGGYHLHPTGRKQRKGIRRNEPGRVYLSRQDREDLVNDEVKIEVVSALRMVKKPRKLKENPFLISGYLRCGERDYRVDVGGYYYNGGIRKAVIEVPRKILKMIR